MGTKPQSSGLLSRVANIFRRSDGPSGKGRADAEESRLSLVDDSEKNALQALIKRKRRDDLVRRREFNYLRKLRRSPNSTSKPDVDGIDRTSSFPNSSGFSVDDRISTLKKIDAIEAHMISSWARSKVALAMPMPKHNAELSTPTGQALFTNVSAQTAKTFAVRGVVPQATRSSEPDDATVSGDLDDLDLDFTGLLSTPGSAAVDTWDAPSKGDTVPMPLGELTAAPAAPAPVPPAPPLAPLPEAIETALHDAAIQFAQGDSAAAEALLLSLLQGQATATATGDVLAFALFDLYRATGQQDGFDVVAMDYAERFERSPAEWFSVPELLAGHMATGSEAPAVAISPAGQSSAWESPNLLTVETIESLQSQFSAPRAVWHVDWVALTEISREAAPVFAKLLAYWCANPVELHWRGVDSLVRTLELYSPANDNTVDPLWWRLRLDALRILQRHDDFESLALDYCVLYEVSPPSWSPAVCTFAQEQSLSGFGAVAEGPQSHAPDELPVLASPFAVCELKGEVCGETPEAMARLVAAGQAADHVVVTCALAVRLDFPAAGAVLNWVIERHNHGCKVQFVKVPRLIAVFFHMLGIDRYARILVRAN